VKCVREMVLMGNTVKIDNLAIFKATVEANGLETMYDASTDKVALATIGNLAEGAKTGPAVKVIKLLAQSTGEFTRDELKKDAKLSWTDKTKAEIAAAKTAATGSSESNGGSQNQGGNGGSSTGSDTGNGGSQIGNEGGGSQATSFALTITKSGSGTSTVKNDSEETINSGDTLASGANVYISVTPAEGQIPTATLNGTNVSLTENDGEYIGTFQMPAQASSLVINSGSDSEEGDQN
jgi:hypothetical protein